MVGGAREKPSLDRQHLGGVEGGVMQWGGVGGGASDPVRLLLAEAPQPQGAKPQPAVPPRPSADLILHRCSESTKRKLASTV